MKLKKIIQENLAVILIALFTLAIHLWRLEELTTFGGDLGYDLGKIYEIVHGNLQLIGSPIGRFADTNLYLGSFYYYFQIPFLLLTRFDPIGVAISVVLARVITATFVFLIAKKMFGNLPAVFSGAIAAVSPYWINYLGPPSPPYFIPTVTAITLYLLLNQKLTVKKFVVVGFLSGLSVHLHYLGLVLFPAVLLFAIFSQKIKNSKSVIGILTGFFLSISPLIVFELKNHFFLTNQLLKQLSVSNTQEQALTLLDKLNFLTNTLAKDTIGIEQVGLIFLFGIVACMLFTLKKSKNPFKPIITLLAFIVVMSITAASLQFNNVQPHYIAAAYVPTIIVTGMLINLTRKIHTVLPIVIILVITSVLISRNNFLSTSGYTMPEDLRLTEIRKISKIISTDVGKDSFNITSTLDGDSRALTYRYLTRIYGKNPQSLQTYDKLDSLYIITRDPAYTVRETSLFEIASFQPSNIANVWEIKSDIRLIKLTKRESQLQPEEKFITVVNPVRPRYLWGDRNIENLVNQITKIKEKNLPATWLLQYETLFDQEVVSVLKDQAQTGELGAFLEVSEKWATDAGVSYAKGVADYYRPDQVFLSGYAPRDRVKLIKTFFKKFNEVFSYRPKTVGAWYIDANSQSLLSQYGVIAALTVADQFDTDAASVWGKYFSFPYYPSRQNTLIPAQNQQDKIPIVNIQWAQRDPIEGYGKEVNKSRQSFQANDYINNGFQFEYFEKLLDNYLTSVPPAGIPNNLMQVTIGLEAGQEGSVFLEEFNRQLELIEKLAKTGSVTPVTTGQFATWYREKYPGLSPSHYLSKGESFWYMSPKMRVAIFKEDNNFLIKDMRYYESGPLKDYFYKDTSPYLDKRVPAVIDQLTDANQLQLGELNNGKIIESFDRLTIISDNKTIQVNPAGIFVDNQMKVNRPIQNNIQRLKYIKIISYIKEPIIQILSPIRYSQINGEKIFGIVFTKTKIIGIHDAKPGIYDFEFQTLSKFKSPKDFIEKYQPWIN